MESVGTYEHVTECKRLGLICNFSDLVLMWEISHRFVDIKAINNYCDYLVWPFVLMWANEFHYMLALNPTPLLELDKVLCLNLSSYD